jgi:hypothetical protein
MTDITMRSNPIMITGIVKPTKAMFWKDRKVGDIVVFEYTLVDPGRNRGLYATRLKVMCGDDELTDTPTSFSARIKSFELSELPRL